MKKYKKIVEAEPMEYGEYCEYRGFAYDTRENLNAKGYLIKQKIGSPSWLQKEVFETLFVEV